MKHAARAAVFKQLAKDSVILAVISLCFVCYEFFYYRTVLPYTPGILGVLVVAWLIFSTQHKKYQKQANDLKVLVDQELSDRIKMSRNLSRV